MTDDEYWSEGIKTILKATMAMYTKQDCQDDAHALVLDKRWHITSYVLYNDNEKILCKLN